MNENLNLVEILKDCPKGISLYSPVYGYVQLVSVSLVKGAKYPIEIIGVLYGTTFGITKDGRIYEDFEGECMLFPSKEQRDWSKFNVKSNKPKFDPKNHKFDPKTLEPFDKVLVRDINSEKWKIQLFSYITERDVDYPYVCITNPYRYCIYTRYCIPYNITNQYRYCIPYNDDTKHLVGTAEEAPEFYRYWEE